MRLIFIFALVALTACEPEGASGPAKAPAEAAAGQSSAKADHLAAVAEALAPCESAAKAMNEEATGAEAGRTSPVEVYRLASRVPDACRLSRESLAALEIPDTVRMACRNVPTAGIAYAEAAMAALDRESVATVAALKDAAQADEGAKMMCAAVASGAVKP